MINLLPDEHKAEIRAGRLNVIFLNYVIMSLLALAFIAVLVILAFVTLSAGRQDAQRRVAENNLSINQFRSVEAAANNYRTDLSTAKKIVDKSINYSDLILKIASTVPPGVVLTSLNLDAKSVGTPMILTVYAKDKNAVLKYKETMQSHPELFSDAKLQSIETRDSEGTKNDTYTVWATLSITINKQALQ